MSNKQDFTVGYIVGLLKHCSQDAYINILVNETGREGDEIFFPITSILIHETHDKKELISFVHELGEEDDL